MKRANPNHALFRSVDSEEDSCCGALQAANERHLARLHSAIVAVSGPYVADDSDLPEIFFRPVMAEDETKTKNIGGSL